ncbi:glycosyltransferase family 2 protein [Virgibacillus ainsalahensis]
MTDDKTVGFDIDYNGNDFQEKRKRLIELEKSLKKEEQSAVYFDEEIKKLERNLQKMQHRYEQEQRINKESKRKLDKMHKSRSWRWSLPIRKVGSLLKKKRQKSYTSHEPSTLEKVQANISARTTQLTAKDLEEKLWGGYSFYALEALIHLKHSTRASLNERIRAARSMARWYYDQEQFDKVYDVLEDINEIKPLSKPNLDRTIPEIKVLKKLGEINTAKRKIWETIKARGLQPELCLSMAHLMNNENERLNWYNLLYDMHGYHQISKIDDSLSLALENIYTPMSHLENELNKYKISVVVPAYNAAGLIHIALNSLLNQTVQNLEIIVVDDCSPDNTAEIVTTYTDIDNRIKLIRKEKNEGAYAARNTGLQYASGDFITIHDVDDWSHSQKLETQLIELINNPEAVGTISYLVRASRNISPINGGSLLGAKFLMMNSSSLLIRKNIFTKLGGWDSVRVAGDSEFIWRIEKVFGKERVIRVEPHVPLSIALSNESSLTATSTTHVKTIKFGLRRTYREAFEWWHNQVESEEELYMDVQKVNRHFPSPVPNLIRQPHSRAYDSVWVADFSLPSIPDTLPNLRKKNEKIAIYHWPYYKSKAADRWAPGVYPFIHRNGMDILVPDEVIETGNLMLLTPEVLDYVLESVPDIKYNQAFIVSDKEISPDQKSKKEKNLVQAMDVHAEWCTIDRLKDR